MDMLLGNQIQVREQEVAEPVGPLRVLVLGFAF